MTDTERALDSFFSQIVRQMLIVFLVIGALGVGIGYLVQGMPGLYGALMGLGVTAFFMGTSAFIMQATRRMSVSAAQGVFVGAWIGKIVVVFIVILLVRDRDFYDPVVFFIVMAVSIIAATVIEGRAFLKVRMPTIDTSQRGM